MKKIVFLILLFVLYLSVYPQTTVFNENFDGTVQVVPTGIPAWSVNSTLQVSGANSHSEFQWVHIYQSVFQSYL